MRKSITIAIIVMALLLTVSCSQQAEDSLCLVSFSAARSRDLTARIDYPAVNSLTWDITAVKADNGGTTGEGVFSDVLLTDELGPFSTGRWEFSLTGRDGETAAYAGGTTAQISEGSNTIEVSVNPIGETGTLVFSGCNFPCDNGSGAQYSGLYIFIDGERVYGAGTQYLTQGEGVWLVPVQTFGLSAGLHDVEITLNGNEPVTAESFKVRVVGGLTTSVTFGRFEGRAGLVVSVDRQEALAE